MNVIASQRALGYANHFKESGFLPIILTFDWSKPIKDQFCEKNEFDGLIQTEEHENYKVIRIPAIKNRFLQFMGRQEGNVLYKIWILLCWLRGDLDVRPEVIAFGKSEAYYLKRYVKNEDIDYVLGIFSPHFHLKNCYHLHKKKQIPYGLDFRDLWNNRIIHRAYAPVGNEKRRNSVVAKNWKKWSSKATSLTITSKPWGTRLSEAIGREVDVVTNGFEPNEVEQLEPVSFEKKEFRLVHTGSLYHQQKLDLLIDGFVSLVEEEPNIPIKLYLIGAIRPGGRKGGKVGFNTEVEEMLANKLPSKYYEVTGRKTRNEALRWLLSAHVLVFPSFPDVPGTYSGKIFEFLMAKRNIMMFPSDNGVCEELLDKTQAGQVCNTAEEIKSYLYTKYIEYRESGSLRFEGNDKINEYSRRSQTKVLADLINKKVAYE